MQQPSRLPRLLLRPAETVMQLGTIVRTSLRSEIRDRVLDGLLVGAFAIGRSLNEVALAADLGVSRTPLREALITLTQQGFLRSEPGRGFFVTPLSATEAQEIYPMVWTLETLGLKLEKPRGLAQLDVLDSINAELAGPLLNAERAVDLDRRWHATLLAHCGNGRLVQTLDTLRAQAWRYEYAYFRDVGRIVTSAAQHRDITSLLRAGDWNGALARLEDNWRQSLEFLIPWLGAAKETR